MGVNIYIYMYVCNLAYHWEESEHYMVDYNPLPQMNPQVLINFDVVFWLAFLMINVIIVIFQISKKTPSHVIKSWLYDL